MLNIDPCGTLFKISILAIFLADVNKSIFYEISYEFKHIAFHVPLLKSLENSVSPKHIVCLFDIQTYCY